MRKAVVTVLSVLVALVIITPALAQEHDSEVTGREYGAHVASHAQQGLLGQEHNPGHHQGFAGFAEHHEEP